MIKGTFLTRRDTERKLKKERERLRKTAQNIIPVRTLYQDGMFDLGCGRFSFAWEFSDINYAIAAPEQQEKMFMDYGTLLSALPTGMDYKITLYTQHISHEDTARDIFVPMRGDASDTMLGFLNETYANLAGTVGDIRYRRCLTVTGSFKDDKEAQNAFKRLEGDLMVSFRRLGGGGGSKLTPLDSEERLRMLYGFYRTGDINAFHFDWQTNLKRGNSFKDAICPDDIAFFPDYIELGGKFARVLFLQDYATYLSDKLIDALMRPDTPRKAALSINLIPLPTNEALKIAHAVELNVETQALKWQRRQNKSLNFSAELPYESTKQRGQIREMLEDLQSQDERMFLMSLTLVHFADTKTQLDNDTETLLSAAEGFSCELRALRWQQEDGFATALPIGVRPIETLRTMTTRAAAIFTPFYCQSFQQQAGTIYGVHARTRELIRLDRRAMRPNGHAWVLATTGGGKSFCGKWELLQTALTTDDTCIVLDPNGEYCELIKALGGQVVKIAPGSNEYINPLEIGTDWGAGESPVASKADYLMTACGLLIGNGGQTNGFYKSIIDRCCRKLYRDLNTPDFVMPTLRDFYLELKEQPQPEAQQLALMLEVYTEGTLDVFAHPGTVNADHRLVCYDLSEIPANLKTFGLITVLDALRRSVMINYRRTIATRIYVDEAHLYFNDEYTGQFLSTATKLYRKFGALFTYLTQNISECMRSDTACLMVSNAEMLYLLRQSSADAQLLAGLLGLSEEEMVYIQNVEDGCGYIRAGGSLVPINGRLQLPPELLVLMSTTPDEIAKATQQIADHQAQL